MNLSGAFVEIKLEKQPKLDVLQPSVQVLPTNEQNAVDPGSIMETLQREEFIERDVL